MMGSRIFARHAQALASSSRTITPTATPPPAAAAAAAHLTASASIPCSSYCQRAALSTSAPVSGTVGSLGGGKLKTHKGTKKRFQPVGSIDGMFKHAHAGKSHLNSHMSSLRRSRLRGMAVTPPGQTARHLKRLLGPIL